MKNEILSIIETVDGKNIKFFEEKNETVVSFTKNILEHDFDFLIIYAQEENMLVINLIHKYETLYENMEADFYEVINKLNQNCIHGYLGFIKEEKTQIAYKSSYIGDTNNLKGNKSLEFFFLVSFDMTDYFHSQLN